MHRTDGPFPRRWQLVADFRTAASTTFVAAAIWAAAWSAAAAADQPTSDDLAKARALVLQLGDPQFVNRQFAQQQLQQMGPAAHDALRDGANADDPEVRRRCQQLLEKVHQAQRRVLITEFLQGQNPDPELPGWNEFSTVTGDSPEARNIYARMLQREWEFLEFVLTRPQDAAVAIDYRTDQIRQHQGRLGLDAYSVLALFFATLHCPAIPDQTVAYVAQLHRNTEFHQTMQRGSARPVIRRLLGTWVENIEGGQSAHLYALSIGLEFDLEQAYGRARRILDERQVIPSYLGFAISAVARFGSLQDVPLLESYFDDSRIITTSHRQNPFGQRQGGQAQRVAVQVQVRDAALYAGLLLHEQDPQSYGFPAIASSDQDWFFRSAGFATDKEREAAFNRWKEFLGQKPPEEP